MISENTSDNTQAQALNKTDVSSSIFKYVEIKNYDNGKVEKRYDVSDRGNSMIDKFERGLNINLNHDKFYTFSYESETKLDAVD